MKKINLKKQFKEAIDYIKNSKTSLIIILIIFFYGAILGFINYENLKILEELFKRIIIKTELFNTMELFFFILQNNLFVSFIGFITGIFLGIPTLIISMVNGIIIGYIVKLSINQKSIIELWKLLPHGIFELTAVFISLAMGLKIAGIFLSKNKISNLKNRFYQGMNVFLFIILPLLTIAAIIETLLIRII